MYTCNLDPSFAWNLNTFSSTHFSFAHYYYFFFSEIHLGRVVGNGGFCTVSLITAVDLDELYDMDEKEVKTRKTFANLANQGGREEGGIYVLKTLRKDLSPEDHEKGVTDLAIEADFLQVLQHKNVITMRAMGNCDPHEGRFFVILDRLSMTLDKKFNYWRKIVEEHVGVWWPIFGYCCSKPLVLHQIWKERIEAAHDIAQAVQYLHNLGIVYRDLVCFLRSWEIKLVPCLQCWSHTHVTFAYIQKPDNIGFDSAGVLKLFDFGLAKRLDEVEKLADGRYNLTGARHRL